MFGLPTHMQYGDEVHYNPYRGMSAGAMSAQANPRTGNHYTTKDNAGTDNVYINAIMEGPNNVSALSPEAKRTTFPAEFSVTRTVPLLDKPSDYYMSVVRFTCPLDNVPILIMPVVPGSLLTQATPFTIGINYQGTNYFSGMIWTPEDYSGLNPPPNQNQAVQIITPYYYMYSYETLINMINNALRTAFTAFVVANPLVPQATTSAPFFFYNSTTQLITLVTPTNWATTFAQFTPSAAGTVRISMNYALQTFLDGFTFLYLNASLPADNQLNIVVTNTQSNGYPINTYPALPTYLQTPQDYNVINFWTSLRKIVVTSSTLPARHEAVPIGPRTNLGSESPAATLPIIADFIPQLNVGGESRSVAYYNPTAVYHLVDMLSDIPLYKVDLKIYWTDKDNNLIPLDISKFQQASVKIGFFKKSLYLKS